MTTIYITTTSRLPPERVLAAGYDFSSRRAAVFPAVWTDHLELHEIGNTSADVTEGTPAGIGVNWERCDYDWSTPGSVLANVTDSNVYQPGESSWELRATPADAGSSVEMIWTRTFKPSARGRVFGTLFKLLGKPIFTHEANKMIRNLESLETNGGTAVPE